MQSLGKYQLIAEIARGGMGIVYLAVASGPAGFSKLFVVKELKPELVTEGDFYGMFLEEARLAARLNHPNIVTTYEVGVDGQRPFIVMDYLDGESLARLMRKKSPLFTPAMHMRVICQMLDGLDYAHNLRNFDDTSATVVHRDVSPQNVFITFAGQVKLVDFGIAKSADTTIETQAGTFKGKPGYMAPEQLGGDVDLRADLFSVGVMIWEACVGDRMFKKMTPLEIITALIRGEIPKLRDIKPDAPEELLRICDKATAKNVDDRYATARALRGDLEAYLDAAHERMTVREIAEIVATIFEPQRKQLRAIIEKCISSAQNGAVSTKLPSLAPPPIETPTTPKPHQHTMPLIAATTLAPPVAQGAAAPPPSDGRVSYVVDTLSGTPDASALPARSMEPPPKKKRRAALVALLLIGLISASVLTTVAVYRAAENHAAVEASRSPAASAPPQVLPPTAVTAPTMPAAADPTAPLDLHPSASPSASASAPVAQRPRFVYVPPPPRPAPPPPAPVVEKPADKTKTDCNPPFYFDGTKKVFKPGCL